MNLKEMRRRACITQKEMSEKFDIPKRTIENWDSGSRECPGYVKKLIAEKLEIIIMENGKKALEKALEINQFGKIPQVEVGDIVSLSDIWDGEGDKPEESYSYLLTQNGEDGDSPNYEIWINYVFEAIEDGENPKIKIVDIELL